MAKIDPIYTPINTVLQKDNSSKDKKRVKKGLLFQDLLKSSKADMVPTQLEESDEIDFSMENVQIERDQLDKVMEQIRDLGKRVTTYRTYNDILRYRSLIKNFISFYVKNSMEAQMVGSYKNPIFLANEDKKMIIHLIDQKLEELTINFLNLHDKPIQLLKSIELIEGLIIDLQA